MQTENLNAYTVSSEYKFSKFFVKIKEDGKEKSIPVRRWKHTVSLRHVSGIVTEFSAYSHRGQVFFKDHRNKSGKPNMTQVIEELQRMLKIDENKAKAIILPQN